MDREAEAAARLPGAAFDRMYFVADMEAIRRAVGWTAPAPERTGVLQRFRRGERPQAERSC